MVVVGGGDGTPRRQRPGPYRYDAIVTRLEETSQPYPTKFETQSLRVKR
jgi:hypothetical protein